MTDRFITPVFTAVDANGETVAGAQLIFYVTGTMTAKNTFSDAGLTTVNPNPVVADFTGRFGDIFLESGDYKVVLKDADDAVIWTRDPVSGMSTAVSSLTDADGDTKIQVEGSADEDKIRFDAGGVEIAVIDSNGLNFNVGGGVTDADGDTKIRLEEGADDDTIGFDVGGTGLLTVDGTNGLKVGSGLPLQITTNGKVRGADGTSGGPTYSFASDDDTGLYRPSDGNIGVATAGSLRMLLNNGGLVTVGNDLTGNANMAVGLTINQGGNDDEILAFKSSDIAHGATALAETDAYATFRKQSGAQGGLEMRAFADTAPQQIALSIEAYLPTGSMNTSKSTGGNALWQTFSSGLSGTSSANLDANANVVAIKGNVGGTARTLFIIDEDGDFHYDGADGGAFDEHDDIALVTSFNDFLGTNSGKLDFERMKSLSDLRLIGEVTPEDWDDGTRPLVNGAQMQRLLVGNSVQAHMREQVLWTALSQLVPGFKEIAEGLSTGRNIGSLSALINA